MLLLDAQIAKHAIADTNGSLQLLHRVGAGLVLEQKEPAFGVLEYLIGQLTVAPVVAVVKLAALVPDHAFEPRDQTLHLVSQPVADNNHGLVRTCILRIQLPLPQTSSGAITKETIDISLIRIFIDGPEVSLNGSPTVSPTTPALCASDPLPP